MWNIPTDCMRVVRGKSAKMFVMKTLIENAEKLEYLTSDSHWTKNAGEAKDFKATGAAIEVAKQEPMGRFNIVGYFPGTKQLFNMIHGRGRGVAETTEV